MKSEARSRALPLLLCVFLVGLLILFAALPRADAIERQSALVLETCAHEEDKTTCYEREVPALYPTFSISDIFQIVRRIRAEDSSYQFCHVLAHKLGERVVADDPERWIEAIPLNPPDGLCSNGFIHGVIGGRFRSEVLDNETLEKLIPDFSRACEPRAGWNPSDLDQAICYHGMGHLYMFVTDADVSKALSLCERTAFSDGDFRKVCREGVFMQIYQPLEPDDFLLIERMSTKPSTTTARSFCARFEKDEYEGACLRESWPFFREDILSGEGGEAFCSGQPNSTEEAHCYESVATIIGRILLAQPEKAKAACNALPKEHHALCTLTVAQATLEEDRGRGESALAMCASEEEGVADMCIKTLADRADFIFGDDKRRAQFCALVPAQYQATCAGASSSGL